MNIQDELEYYLKQKRYIKEEIKECQQNADRYRDDVVKLEQYKETLAKLEEELNIVEAELKKFLDMAIKEHKKERLMKNKIKKVKDKSQSYKSRNVYRSSDKIEISFDVKDGVYICEDMINHRARYFKAYENTGKEKLSSDEKEAIIAELERYGINKKVARKTDPYIYHILKTRYPNKAYEYIDALEGIANVEGLKIKYNFRDKDDTKGTISKNTKLTFWQKHKLKAQANYYQKSGMVNVEVLLNKSRAKFYGLLGGILGLSTLGIGLGKQMVNNGTDNQRKQATESQMNDSDEPDIVIFDDDQNTVYYTEQETNRQTETEKQTESETMQTETETEKQTESETMQTETETEKQTESETMQTETETEKQTESETMQTETETEKQTESEIIQTETETEKQIESEAMQTETEKQTQNKIQPDNTTEQVNIKTESREQQEAKRRDKSSNLNKESKETTSEDVRIKTYASVRMGAHLYNNPSDAVKEQLGLKANDEVVVKTKGKNRVYTVTKEGLYCPDGTYIEITDGDLRSAMESKGWDVSILDNIDSEELEKQGYKRMLHVVADGIAQWVEEGDTLQVDRLGNSIVKSDSEKKEERANKVQQNKQKEIDEIFK